MRVGCSSAGRGEGRWGKFIRRFVSVNNYMYVLPVRHEMHAYVYVYKCTQFAHVSRNHARIDINTTNQHRINLRNRTQHVLRKH